MQALHFGSGNIGKGFIGKLLNDSGYNVCFVDVDEQNIEAINRQNSYVVEMLNERQDRTVITSVKALNSRTQPTQVMEAIVHADVITTSVGVNNLPVIAGLLSKGLLTRGQKNKHEVVDVIANENAINASSRLKEEISKLVSKNQMSHILSFVGFPNTSIDRLALSKNNEVTTTLVEPYYEWIINESEMKNNKVLPIENATYVKDLTYFIERKLYIVNMGHAATAYLGKAAQKPTIQSALKDAKIKQSVRSAMQESSYYIQHKFGVSTKELEWFINDTLKRFENPFIEDSVLRVGRSPIRKLSEQERLVKPLLENFLLGRSIESLTSVIAAGFMFYNTEDEGSIMLQEAIKKHGLRKTIGDVTNIKNETIINEIERKYRMMV